LDDVLQIKQCDVADHPTGRQQVDALDGLEVLYLPNTDKYRGLTRRPSQEQKGLDERTRMASQRPFPPW
jgi:hypothetical protein